MNRNLVLALLVSILLSGACKTAPDQTAGTGSQTSDASQAVVRTLSMIEVITEPAGGTVTVEETARLYKDGDRFMLPAGRYTFTGEKKGYPGRALTVDVDGKTAKRVTLVLGDDIKETSADRVRLKTDAVAPATTPQKRSRIKAVTDPVGETVSVKTKPRELKKPPTHGTVSISTQPDGGTIFLEGNQLGIGTAELEKLVFGPYTVRGEKPLSRGVRLVGEQSFTVQDAAPLNIHLRLDRRQRKYAGEWRAESEALSMEGSHYRSRRVNNPFEIKAVLDSSGFGALKASENLHEKLHAVLRVGDRVSFVYEGRTWTVWKRDDVLTPDFEEAVKAFKAQLDIDFPWPGDPPEKRFSVSAQKETVAAIALKLLRAGTKSPLIDLAAGQLSAAGATIPRLNVDGALTILVTGGKDVKIVGITEKTFDGLRIATAAPADTPLSITWRTPPDRLLVVGDRDVRLVPQAKNRMLKIGEKKIVTLIENAKIKTITRLSYGPDYEGWKHQVFKVEGPLAAQIDLSRDEIGPNESPGLYRRIWLLQIKVGERLTQRQTEAIYRVGGERKEFESDQFIRRKPGKNKKD